MAALDDLSRPADDQTLIDLVCNSDLAIAQTAYTVLARRRKSGLLLLIRKHLVPGVVDADDVCQETLMKGWHLLRSSQTPFRLHEGKNFGAFLGRIALNLISNEYQWRNRHRTMPYEKWSAGRSTGSQSDDREGPRHDETLEDKSHAHSSAPDWLNTASDEEVERFCHALLSSVLARLPDSEESAISYPRAAGTDGIMLPDPGRSAVLRALARLQGNCRDSYLLDLLQQKWTHAEIGTRLGIAHTGTVDSHVSYARAQLLALLAYELTRDEYSERDIARMLNVPDTRIASHIARGRALCERHTRQKEG